jgi:predicted enzyme related to lactoylglutathione lyase
MPRIVHFELGADQPERAAKFYEDVFDWKIQKWDGPAPYWLAQTGDEKEMGINGGIMNRMPGVQNSVNTIGVDDLDAYVAKVRDSGGSIIEARIPVPGIGYMAYAKDTEGNMFGLMQSDPSAK